MAHSFVALPPDVAEWMGLDETILPLAVAFAGTPADPADPSPLRRTLRAGPKN
jgi:hypothetical protein